MTTPKPGDTEATGAPPLDGVEENLRTLFYALLNHFRDKLGLSFSVAELHKLVVGVLKDMNVGATDIGWDVAEPATLSECKRHANLHRPLRVPALVAETRDPVLVSVAGAGGEDFEVEAMSARFIDREGTSMWSLDITGEALIERVQSQFQRGGQAELLCVPVALPKSIDRKHPGLSMGSSRRGFYLHLADLRASTSTLDLLAASGSERTTTEKLLEELQEKKMSPFTFLEDRVIKKLNIVGLDEFPLLRGLIRFTVLQSLSTGRIDHAPARLHGMVVGPPGQGKKLVGLAARALNPVCEEVSPTKVSAAGLVGASRNTDGGWVSQPGAIPRANGGVVVLQDAHGWQQSLVNKIAPILQEVMEDGVARDAVAGGIVREAQSSLLFDLNRTSQVRAGGLVLPGRMEAAILQVRPVLSRMDLLCEIPPDVERAWDVARRLYRSMGTGHVTLDDQPWVREARLLVAALRDRHPEVNIDRVRELMATTHDDIRKSNADLFDSRPELGDVPARMAISFVRFVSASARSRDRSIAEPIDVVVAATFITMKLRFLAMTGVSWVPASGEEAVTPAEWVGRYRGEEVGSSEARAAYQQATGRSADERTFRRALIALGGVRTSKGRYLLPPG